MTDDTHKNFRPYRSDLLRVALAALWLAVFGGLYPLSDRAQSPIATPVPTPQVARSSGQFVDALNGVTVERLVADGFTRRADLLAARQRVAVASARLAQAGAKPNPTLEAEYGTPRILGGDPETDFSIGVTQTFELGGKRRKRVVLAALELAQTRAEVAALERRFAAFVRAGYARAVAAANQLDALEILLQTNNELARITAARLKEGDIAPLDANLLQVENDRLRVQIVEARAELESEIIELRALTGLTPDAPLVIAPLPVSPPRLELTLAELNALALGERQDLQAARLNEATGSARLDLARAQAKPDLNAGVGFARNKEVIDLPASAGGATFANADNSLTFKVAVELPVFNRNQGAIAAAVAENIAARQSREFLEADIRREVAQAYRKYRAASEVLVLYATSILPRANENFRSVQAAYGLGEYSIFDVLNEQRRLLESQGGYNAAVRDYYAALAELEAAAGTTLPAAGFAPPNSSLAPDEKLFRLARPLTAGTQATLCLQFAAPCR